MIISPEGAVEFEDILGHVESMIALIFSVVALRLSGVTPYQWNILWQPGEWVP